MIRTTILSLLLALLAAPTMAEELQPPNVSFYTGLQGSRNDFTDFGLPTRANGGRVQLGMWLEDVHPGRWKVGLEGGYNRLGQETASQSITRSPTAAEKIQFGGADQVTVDSSTDVNVTGLEMGVRLYDSELFYVRAGAYLYSFKSTYNETRKIHRTTNATVTNTLTPQATSTSSVGPYIGAGFRFPVTKSLAVTSGFDLYRVESSSIQSLSLGVEYHFK